MHIIGNMVFLWAFGRAMEDAMGHPLPLLLSRRRHRRHDGAGPRRPDFHIPCLGASGAIAAVMGAFIVTFPRDRIRTFIFFLIFFRVTYIPAVFLIGFWFLMQVLNFGVVAEARTGGVAYLAHIAGFLFGVVTARLFVNPRRMTYRRFS